MATATQVTRLIDLAACNEGCGGTVTVAPDLAAIIAETVPSSQMRSLANGSVVRSADVCAAARKLGAPRPTAAEAELEQAKREINELRERLSQVPAASESMSTTPAGSGRKNRT